MRNYLFILMLAAILPVYASAFSVAQVYSGASPGCAVFNLTNVTCRDGVPITVGFILSSQQYPSYYYGNFTAHSPASSGIANPVTIYGSTCQVSSLSNTECFVTLEPIPITKYNGTTVESVVIDLVSARFPQVQFTDRFNITIHHYDNQTSAASAELYNSTSSAYGSMSTQYEYLCSVYHACNSTIGADISTLGYYVGEASNAIAADDIDLAYLDSNYANRTLSEITVPFFLYSNRSIEVVGNMVNASTDLGSAKFEFSTYQDLLYNCNLTAATRLRSSLSNASAYVFNDTPASTYAYYLMANALERKVYNQVNGCEGKPITAASLSSQSSGQSQPRSPPIAAASLSPFSSPVIYAILIPAIIAVAYGLLKFRDMRETSRLREEANRHDQSKEQPGAALHQPEGQQPEPPKPDQPKQ